MIGCHCTRHDQVVKPPVRAGLTRAGMSGASWSNSIAWPIILIWTSGAGSLAVGHARLALRSSKYMWNDDARRYNFPFCASELRLTKRDVFPHPPMAWINFLKMKRFLFGTRTLKRLYGSYTCSQMSKGQEGQKLHGKGLRDHPSHDDKRLVVSTTVVFCLALSPKQEARQNGGQHGNQVRRSLSQYLVTDVAGSSFLSLKLPFQRWQVYPTSIHRSIHIVIQTQCLQNPRPNGQRHSVLMLWVGGPKRSVRCEDARNIWRWKTYESRFYLLTAVPGLSGDSSVECLLRGFR